MLNLQRMEMFGLVQKEKQKKCQAGNKRAYTYQLAMENIINTIATGPFASIENPKIIHAQTHEFGLGFT